MKPPFPNPRIGVVRKGFKMVELPVDPAARLEALCRLSNARRSLVEYVAPTPAPGWLERKGVDVLVAALAAGVFGYILGVVA